MAEMNAQQTMEYLKQASALETSVYQQEEVRKKAHATLVTPNVKRQEIERPIKKEPKSPTPREPAFKECFEERLWVPVVAFFSILCGGVSHLLCLAVDLDLGLGLIWVGFGVAILDVFIGLILSAKDYFEARECYARAWENYAKESKQIEDAYNVALKEYSLAVLTADKRYASEQQAAQRAYQLASEEVKKLDAPLADTQKLLARIYDADIIFPKYRNMVAMCTMYEYFASGRCTELMGPTGAYNLYEAELRQNLIINQLERVNANLEQVKQNQYILYQGIVETNRVLGEVSTDIKGILNMTTDIAVSGRITAFCSQITATNTAVQTYLELMD